MPTRPQRRVKLGPGRPGFMEWVALQPTPNWGAMPLTHITRGVIADDILRSGQISPSPCRVFEQPLAYLFYGRPAYRIGDNGVTKTESFCPFCFLFKPQIVEGAEAIHAFDTGAFAARMYSNVLPHEMSENDFRLNSVAAANQLISATFGSQETYFDGDTRVIGKKPPAIRPHDFHAKAYMDLVLAPGRNEPDDRVYSIEVVFTEPVPLNGALIGIVLPHTLCAEEDMAPWLEPLVKAGIPLIPYNFIPGRHPEHYHTLMERAVKEFYQKQNFLVP